MRETMLPEGDPGWCFFLSVGREEAAPRKRKKRRRPKGSGTVYSCVWRWIL